MTDADLVEKCKGLDFVAWRGGVPVFEIQGDGWNEVLWKYLELMGRYASELEVVVSIQQIKEKFGGLRLYYELSGVPSTTGFQIAQDALDMLVLRAERECSTTCEYCGARCFDNPASVKGWVHKVCKACLVTLGAAS